MEVLANAVCQEAPCTVPFRVVRVGSVGRVEIARSGNSWLRLGWDLRGRAVGGRGELLLAYTRWR